MYCETYRCTMSKMSCYARRKNALRTGAKHQFKPGFGDANCQNCEKGAAIMEEIDPAEAARYSAELRKIRNKAFENMGKETPKNHAAAQPEMKVCSDPDTGKKQEAKKIIQAEAPGLEKPITISFADHPELLKRIAETAALEYRTPADQLLWMVRSYTSPMEVA